MIAISISSDFAPDWAISNVLDLLHLYEPKVTWFSTEEAPKGHGIQPGIYANFMPASTQGEIREQWRVERHSKVIDTCLKENPNAKAIRTRSMYDSEWLMEELLVRTKITHDSCLFLPECEWAKPFEYRRYGHSIVRVPVTWQDYYWLFRHTEMKTAEHAVFDFHVKHIALNTPSIDHYERLRGMWKQQGRSPEARDVWEGDGVRDIFIHLCKKYRKDSQWITEFTA